MTTVKSPGASPFGRVLVVGGYGAVGTAVTSALDAWFPGRVIPAGRDGAKAHRLGGVRTDIADPEAFGRTLDELIDVTLVVLCAEPPDTTAAELCFERGIDLVDTGATSHLLDALTELGPLARRTGASAVLSTGVAPGLSNLLARRAHQAVGGAEHIDLTLLLGTGDHHGTDAVRWTLTGLTTPMPAAPLRIDLPGYGTRTTYPFPFSDQYTLPRTLGVPHVTTRLCLDSRALTAGLLGLRRAPARLAEHAAARRLLTGLMGRIHLGGDGFAVRADAYRAGRHAAYALTGNRQSLITGLVAAHAARAVFTGAVTPGVHHIEEIPGLARLPEDLTGNGIRLLRPRGETTR
ncbi:saccharopine dehydrogenase family protein [Streptomyces qinzhouensis]|uniref:Saccharopine dehydrogenase n=1 Tax=Streptomyces qinzhouensis TaxID=2599401 RepID=A0A5B8JRZ8_9ACTN|nr:saccharopine dehydrogenase [Streptomyces qinzhouensis]QDY80563.1 saccharopine dehydrogenase [Streptomyces qinzhouensis]